MLTDRTASNVLVNPEQVSNREQRVTSGSAKRESRWSQRLLAPLTESKDCVSLQSHPHGAASVSLLFQPVRPLSPNWFLPSVSQLTEHTDTIDYSPVMRQVDFYFHDGCLSQQSILLLTRELRQNCPAWHISAHPLLEHEAKALGFQILPTTVINGSAIATGMPKIGWLLDRMKECENAGGEQVD
ncbi:MAG: hypothetical protein L0H94_03805 [Nitrospira sp.]|nr:hypothetical protein [Nitrospira sp.]